MGYKGVHIGANIEGYTDGSCDRYLANTSPPLLQPPAPPPRSLYPNPTHIFNREISHFPLLMYKFPLCLTFPLSRVRSSPRRADESSEVSQTHPPKQNSTTKNFSHPSFRPNFAISLILPKSSQFRPTRMRAVEGSGYCRRLFYQCWCGDHACSPTYYPVAFMALLMYERGSSSSKNYHSHSPDWKKWTRIVMIMGVSQCV